MGTEYVFIDEWHVNAPLDATFHTLADARTYPAWWKPVYISVEADGPPAAGAVCRQHFKGRLLYHLRTTSQLIRFEPPREFEVRVEGDLRGRGVWTLTPTDRGVHIRFDWRVNAERPLLRMLTPILKPVFRWNHHWAIQRAREGLEPYLLEQRGRS